MLTTVFTAIRIFVGVRILVLYILSPVIKALVTGLALKAIVLRMSTTMAFQIGFLVSAVLAEITIEHPQPCVN